MDKNLYAALIYMDELRKSIDGIVTNHNSLPNNQLDNIQGLRKEVNNLRSALESVSDNLRGYVGQYGIASGYVAEVGGGIDDLIQAVTLNPVTADAPQRHIVTEPLYASNADRERKFGLPNVSEFIPPQDIYDGMGRSVLQDEIEEQQRYFRGYDDYPYYEQPEPGMRSISEVMDMDHNGMLQTHGTAHLGLRLSRRDF